MLLAVILWSERRKPGKSRTSLPSPTIMRRRVEKPQTGAKLFRSPNKIAVESAFVCGGFGNRNVAHENQQAQSGTN